VQVLQRLQGLFHDGHSVTFCVPLQFNNTIKQLAARDASGKSVSTVGVQDKL
jgi:hypothetical protein